MKLLEISIADLNIIVLYVIGFFVAMAVLLICNFNSSRKKIKSIEINRFY